MRDELGSASASLTTKRPDTSLTVWLARILKTLEPLDSSTQPEDVQDLTTARLSVIAIASSRQIPCPTRRLGAFAELRGIEQILPFATCEELLASSKHLFILFGLSDDEMTLEGHYFRELTRIILTVLERHQVALTTLRLVGDRRVAHRFLGWASDHARTAPLHHALLFSGAVHPSN